jgi:aminomethyltransferase
MSASIQALDTLRLEAGLCWKGKELHEKVNPVEAGLGWTIPSRRRCEGDFYGAEALVQDGKLQKMERKRVGIICPYKVPAECTQIFDAKNGVMVGEITSASFSPSLEIPIAMAYIEKALAKAGTEIYLKIARKDGKRHKMYKAEIVGMPFVPNRFHKVPN